MPETRAPHLLRVLTLFDVVCIGINAVVGSGIFFFPGQLAGFLGPASVASFGVVGLLLINVGLCYAEASTHFNRTGGGYLYARAAFGDWVGFAIGWMAWITQMFSWAAVANVIAVYLGFFNPVFEGRLAVKAFAAVVVVGMGALNYRGVKLGARTSDFFTVAKLVPLGLFVLLGLFFLGDAHFRPFAPHGWRPLGPACFLAFFAFQGFEYMAVPSGEIDKPARTIPLALIIALTLTSVLYMAVQAIAVGVDPALATSARPLASAAMGMLGWAGAALMVGGAVVSTTGYNSSAALVTPRYLEALADDGHLPKGLAAVHPRFETPYRAILLTTAISLVMALFLDFDKLVDFSNVVVCAQYVATCLAVPFLRRRFQHKPGDFRLPGGWTIPLIGVAAVAWLGAQGGMSQVWWSLAILAFGLALKAGWRRAAPRFS
ncbi:MAG: amino acid permease [Elusimicrobia bacterium]|nr:amino acid permease [Elusimicrobiota bacterium]